MKKRFLLLLIIFKLYSFNFLEKRATDFIKNQINFPATLTSNVSHVLSIFAAGAGLSLMTDRPYKTMFLLSTLFSLYFKKNKELKRELEKNYLDKEEALIQEKKRLENSFKEEKSNLDLEIENMEKRNQALLQELNLKNQRDIASQEKIEESMKHDDAVVRSLRWQNINLVKELQETYKKYAKKMDTATSQSFKKILFNSLVSPLFFYKKKSKKNQLI